jgi:hypothetical protein
VPVLAVLWIGGEGRISGGRLKWGAEIGALLAQQA